MRKYTKKSNGRKSVKKIPRGGFTNPGMTSVKAIGRLIEQNAGRGSSAGSYVRRSLSRLEQAKVVADIAGTAYSVVSDGIARGRDKDTIAESKTTTTGTFSPSSTVGRKFRTEFTVGKMPTSSVKQMERLGGSRKLVSHDTEVSDVASTRDSLTLRTGFNQKTVKAYDQRSYWDMEDLISLSDASSFTRNWTQWQKAYWMTKFFGVKYKMYNKNKYTSMKVNVHFVKLLAPLYGPKEYLAESFSATLPNVATVQEGTIPYNLQMTAMTNDANSLRVGIDPQLGSLRKANSFNSVFKIEKTFSRNIAPGETWELDYKHYTGPGLCLNDIIRQEQDTNTFSQDAPAFFYPIFEIVGSQVECVDSTDEFKSYIGNSSGSVQLEMKKYCEIVTNTSGLSEVYDLTGLKRGQWAFKVYTDYSTGSSTTSVLRRFNVDVTDILREGEAAAAGKFIIPVSTETNTARGGRSNIGT